MNKAQRKAIANRLAEIAIKHGAIVRLGSEEWSGIGRIRSLRFEADFEHVRLDSDIDDLHGGGLMIHWFRATKPLANPGPFDSVNSVHRGKATMYRDSAEKMYEAFDRACAAVVDGSAFDEGWTPTPRRPYPG